jgi:hypothetical protein
MDIPLGGVGNHCPEGSIEVANPAAAAEEFLEQHKSAKIIVVIDTHCLENGAFVYDGQSPENYKACFINRVSAPKYPI